MEEGELYAIETFGSTGKGVVHEDMECRYGQRVKTNLAGFPLLVVRGVQTPRDLAGFLCLLSVHEVTE